MKSTRIEKARTHNLKEVSLELEPGAWTVLVGPTGSGKSSLALDTIYAEGQRRYVESFSPYARQFLERLPRPPVESIDRISAAVAVDRKAPVRTSRSTVGTMTEIVDYAKALWVKEAKLFIDGRLIDFDSPDTVASQLLEELKSEKILVSYPFSLPKDTEGFLGVRETLMAEGYRRVVSDGAVRDFDSIRPAETDETISVLVDRLVVRDKDRGRLVEAIESAFRRGLGRCFIEAQGGEKRVYSDRLYDEKSGKEYTRPSAGLFSFNSPIGACEECRGFGRVMAINWDRVFDFEKTAAKGGIRPWKGRGTQWERAELKKFAQKDGFPLTTKIGDLSKDDFDWLKNGSDSGFFGVQGFFDWLETRSYKMSARVVLSRFRDYVTCGVCNGKRLKPEAECWQVDGWSVSDFLGATATDALAFVERQLDNDPDEASLRALDELHSRTRALVEAGVGYLTLDRQSRTLSGGEAQRVALTGALGTTLTHSLFVIDEPSVGLHPADLPQLENVIRRLQQGDNSILMIEHKRELIEAAERIVELGPGAGDKGGQIVFDGSQSEFGKSKTKTAKSTSLACTLNQGRVFEEWFGLRGCRGNNLKNVDLMLPVGGLTCVIGRSGSGKSSLVLDTLAPALATSIGLASERALEHDEVVGAESFSDVQVVKQEPLGRTSRGMVMSYVGVYDELRKLFARTDVAKKNGWSKGYFSVNTVGGRCEVCKGQGTETVEMQFLADVTFPCDSCRGQRYVGEILDAKVHGYSIDECFRLTVDHAAEIFKENQRIQWPLFTLQKVGLGYIRLGQSLSTLSGGEAQRLKIAKALKDVEAGSLLVLDEPTAGLHSDDAERLFETLSEMRDHGTTVVVVEHSMRYAARADYLIELGPAAGKAGGTVVAEGPPAEVAVGAQSPSAPFLQAVTKTAKRRRKRTRKSQKGSARESIKVRGAREHNLKNVDVEFPTEKLTVVTGPSGSGKSTLAFDIVYAEGQRRFLETLSPYARQYMPQLPRPDVGQVIGVPPVVSLEQRLSRAGGNSTVATVTEIAHYLRLLFARIGNVPKLEKSAADYVDPAAFRNHIRRKFKRRKRVDVWARAVSGRKGFHKEVFQTALAKGVTKARVDGEIVGVDPVPELERYQEHDIELLVVPRARMNQGDDLLTALQFAATLAEDGCVVVQSGRQKESAHLAEGIEALSAHRTLDPRMFSFNTRQGGCPECQGRGEVSMMVGRGKKKREAHNVCSACQGTRLSAFARSVTFRGESINDYFSLTISEALAKLLKIRLKGRQDKIARPLIDGLVERLRFLESIGVGYLGLDRSAATLSGGEMQRVRLAAQLGSGLTGVLYVLDEPTIGLHARDTDRLIGAFRKLVDQGNSVMVVEHDLDIVIAADHVVDIGPRGGTEGGRVVAVGTPAKVKKQKSSSTGRALARGASPVGGRRKTTKRDPAIELEGATLHNLRGDSAAFRLERLNVVTGVSGSGKSSLVRGVLLPAVRHAIGLESNNYLPDKSGTLTGFESLRRAVEVDQSPIGRTSRSVPVTYIKVWKLIRELLAGSPEARTQGWSASRFSFNTKEGRCTACEGKGYIVAEMAFLPDVHLHCETCNGMRFGRETLTAKFRGLHAGDLLNLEVRQAMEVFSSIEKIAHPLRLLDELGLGYLKLGQPSNTLSGGEAQRIKLVSELGKSARGRSLYVLDEPTTGLHREDVDRLINVIQKLVDRGDTVVVIEHQPDMIAQADWVIDLGPEGGKEGGKVVVQGPPQRILKRKRSFTGAMLRAMSDDVG